MKQLEIFRVIVKTLFLLRQMPAGQGWATPQEIINYSGIAHSTVYRYMPKLATLGFVEMEEYSCRKLRCKRYRVTNEGAQYIEYFRAFI